MEIIVAKTAGFCFGVKRAVDMAFVNEYQANTYTYGPIIHNEVVTGELEQKGIYAINEIDEYNVNKLIIRSHGVSPEVYEKGKKQNIEIVDATCPYVKKIHRYVEKYDANGYYILIAGNADHPEIKGINGWGRNQCFIAKDVEELKEMKLPVGKFLFVAQTTYKKEVVDKMREYLEEQGIEVEYINTICNATKERQEEAVTLAKQVDCMLVLGSPSSSNTRKLYEISMAYCKNTYCVTGASQLYKEIFNQCESVGITAGASTPQSVIDEVIAYIKQIQE